jgi:hypothetical protein
VLAGGESLFPNAGRRPAKTKNSFSLVDSRDRDWIRLAPFPSRTRAHARAYMYYIYITLLTKEKIKDIYYINPPQPATQASPPLIIKGGYSVNVNI